MPRPCPASDPLYDLGQDPFLLWTPVSSSEIEEFRLSRGSEHVVLGPAASASPRNLPEMKF